MQLPRTAARLAEAQLGVIARWQLRQRLPEGEADRLLRYGGFEALHRGVHRVVGGARLPEQAAMAAALRCGPDATLSGPVVLRLLDVDGARGDDPFVVLLPPRRRFAAVDFPVRRDPDPVGRWLGGARSAWRGRSMR